MPLVPYTTYPGPISWFQLLLLLTMSFELRFISGLWNPVSSIIIVVGLSTFSLRDFSYHVGAHLVHGQMNLRNECSYSLLMNNSGWQAWFPNGPRRIEFMLPIMLTLTTAALYAFFLSFLSYSSIPISWDHFPNKLPTPGLGAVLEENKLKQRIIYSLG